MKEVTFDFTGKNYMVVGATSGIGSQVLEELRAANAQVLAIGRNESRLIEIQKSGGSWHMPSMSWQRRSMIGKQS